MTIRARFAVERSGFALRADLELPGRGITALFGPSGSGKTTLLRAIAGLERHPGSLSVNGECWQDDARGLFLPTHRRPLGYVFQEASLLPHLTVRANLDFGWKRVAPELRRVERRLERKVERDSITELLGIGHLLERMPDQLSGGERQRVAIARALLTSPALLLMDEPLAALDEARRLEVLPYLERLHAQLAVPIVYVSHAAEEVARLADHLVLLEAGQVRAQGPIGALAARADLPAAFDQHVGAVVDGIVAGFDARYHLLRVRCGGAVIQLVHQELSAGTRVRIRVLARDVSLSLGQHGDSSLLNQLPVTVSGAEPTARPGHMLVRLDAGGLALVARITLQSHERLGIAPGMAMWAQFKAAAVLSSA